MKMVRFKVLMNRFKHRSESSVRRFIQKRDDLSMNQFSVHRTRSLPNQLRHRWECMLRKIGV
ncbi:hypothetical protein MTR_0049s0100 [Medicago truncatula]|uniref:Uncharacterized protein n=1 Tax=Medicago truncatula TaxID=3880 RepID=G8A0P8_MEDTR|nr:hypothetical protein MTR_0049s0100 [Medicago truncatula]